MLKTTKTNTHYQKPLEKIQNSTKNFEEKKLLKTTNKKNHILIFWQKKITTLLSSWPDPN